jgi:hypothetical protein
MSDYSSLSSIMKWEGPKLTGSENFAEWKQYIVAVSVSMDIYHLVEQEDVPHTTAVSRRRAPTTPLAPLANAAADATSTGTNTRSAETETTPDPAQLDALALRNKQQRRFWGLLYNSLHINVVKQIDPEARNPARLTLSNSGENCTTSSTKFRV